MNRSSILITLTVLTLILGIHTSPASAQSGVVNVPVNANLVPGLSVIAFSDVQFGTVTINNLSGTVVLDHASDTVTSSGGAVSVDANTFHRGEIRFTAPASGTVSIFQSGGTGQVKLNGTLPLTSDVRYTPTVSISNPTVTTGDVVSIFVGGSLNFGPSTPGDSYSGAVSLTVAYP